MARRFTGQKIYLGAMIVHYSLPSPVQYLENDGPQD